MPARLAVLLVDDDPAQCESLADLLTFLDCDVSAFSDPVSALAASRIRLFDLVLIDLRLPGVSSIDFLRQIKLREHSYVLLLTGTDPTELRDIALQEGADGVIEKPVKVADLMAWIDAAGKSGDGGGVMRGFCLCAL